VGRYASQVSDYAFMVTQVGDKSSAERSRADEVSDHIAGPVLAEFGLQLQRSDRDPTPGQITLQILRSLIEARVVIADLTGRNPNVYYELAIAHSFTRPVIALVDDPRNVAFDVKDERLIPLGSYDGGFRLREAEEAKKALRAALQVVLAEGFRANSIVTDVASARSLDTLAPADPVAAELAALRESVEEVRQAVQQRPVTQGPDPDWRAVIALVEESVDRGFTIDVLDSLDRERTSYDFDEWWADLRGRVIRRDEARRFAI
jgi:hypothetical protein